MFIPPLKNNEGIFCAVSFQLSVHCFDSIPAVGWSGQINYGCDAEQYIGHNPLGRLAISFMFLLMFIMAVTGLVRAGTDIYYPPFGSTVADYIAAPGIDPDTILPYVSTGTDKNKVASLKAFKGPFGKIHIYSSYVLMFMIVLHIFFVVRAEIREGGSLITAMVTGKKILTKKPVDSE